MDRCIISRNGKNNNNKEEEEKPVVHSRFHRKLNKVFLFDIFTV